MKKLQGAQLRKVGHEGGLAADLREGCRGPLPSRPGKVGWGASGPSSELCRGARLSWIEGGEESLSVPPHTTLSRAGGGVVVCWGLGFTGPGLANRCLQPVPSPPPIFPQG